MIQDYEQYITEARTNPTFISKETKTWVMELIPEMNQQTRLVNFDRIVDHIIIGLQQGLHEYEKVFPNDMEVSDKIKETIQKLS
jgi:hypothetical protein